MAVDMMSYAKSAPTAEMVIQEAAAGIRSLEILVRHLSQPAAAHPPAAPEEVVGETVSRFQKVISMVGRTGHARFRRAPQTPPPEMSTTPDQSPPAPMESTPPQVRGPMTLDFTRPAGSALMASTSPASKEGSLQTRKTGGKPPLAVRKCSGVHGGAGSSGVRSSGRPCHCGPIKKSRKDRVLRQIRVPAVSAKIADIPADGYSWRKYGQKPIKGTPHHRAYYRCSTVQGCPAKKHVERAVDDADMLVVSYEEEHRHSPSSVLPPPPPRNPTV